MKTIALLSASVATSLVALLAPAPAHADPRTWVASYGSGTTCSRSAPCADLQTAYNVTDDGGEINCLDASGDVTLGSVMEIQKSITIDCAGTASLAKSFGEMTIDAPGIVVTLRNLAFTMGDDFNGVERGVIFLRGSALHIENCRIANYRVGITGFGLGIKIAPSSGITGAIFVSDTVITNNGLAASGGGIIIQPSGTGSARVVLDRVRVEGNTYGIFANGMDSTGLISIQIRDSIVSGSAFNGISAFTAAGKATTSITVDRSSSILNGQAGILAQGANGFVILGNSTVISNGTGLSTADGGNIFTYQNNQLTGNVADGAATAVLGVK